jgi:FkbM family methyltransferase
MFQKFKEKIKESLCARLNIPYSTHGMPISLSRHLSRDQPISLVDVGAHNGAFTRAVAEYCGVARGILIEPLPEKISMLRQLFPTPKYHVVDCALSSYVGIIDFEVNEATGTSSILNIKRDIPELAAVHLGSRKIIQCPTRTLDDVANEANLNSIDLLKIDVQGAEHLVLLGAEKTLEGTSMVWTEVSFKPLYERSSTFLDIHTLLSDLDFRFMELEPGFRAPDGELLQGDALFIRK